MKNISVPGMIIFDHDGTLVNTDVPDFKLFSGVKELLVDLSKASFVMSVWTARGHHSTLESLKRLEIATFFWEVYGHDDGLPKPHSMGLTKITEGFEKKNIVHIGDSIGDLEGANAFGIDVIAACWNSTNQVEIFKRKTPFLAMNPDDCRKIISEKFKIDL